MDLFGRLFFGGLPEKVWVLKFDTVAIQALGKQPGKSLWILEGKRFPQTSRLSFTQWCFLMIKWTRYDYSFLPYNEKNQVSKLIGRQIKHMYVQKFWWLLRGIQILHWYVSNPENDGIDNHPQLVLTWVFVSDFGLITSRIVSLMVWETPLWVHIRNSIGFGGNHFASRGTIPKTSWIDGECIGGPKWPIFQPAMSVDLFGVSRGLTRLGRLDTQQRDGGWVWPVLNFCLMLEAQDSHSVFFVFFSNLRFTTRFFQIQECQFLNSKVWYVLNCSFWWCQQGNDLLEK